MSRPFVWILLSIHMHTNSTETCPDTFLFQPLEWSSWERNLCLYFKYSETHISIQLRPNVKSGEFKLTGMFRREAGNSTPFLNCLTPGSSHCTRANTHNKNCLLISLKDMKSTFFIEQIETINKNTAQVQRQTGVKSEISLTFYINKLVAPSVKVGRRTGTHVDGNMVTAAAAEGI